MICSLCDKVALRVVGKRGFCKEHRPEADARATREQKNSQSKNSVSWAIGGGRSENQVRVQK